MFTCVTIIKLNDDIFACLICSYFGCHGDRRATEFIYRATVFSTHQCYYMIIFKIISCPISGKRNTLGSDLK